MKSKSSVDPVLSFATPSRRGFLKASAAVAGAAVAGAPLILRGAADSTAANTKLKLAVVGCGGQGRGDMKGLLNSGAVLAALCDTDAGMIAQARADAGKHGEGAKAYPDYRKLLDDASSFDAVLIATPDHWHAPLCRAFIKAGKHVYCEKPLTHSVAEARELRELAKANPKVVTQMGNQGSASASCRRCVELIKAGALGKIHEIYHWGIGVNANEGVPKGEDPIPTGFDWDFWVGPSPMRPFKKGTYHPASWRNWFDFGNGGLADFCCHAINMPMRALDLVHPNRLVLNMKDGKQLDGKAAVEFHFPSRGELPPVVFHWQGNGKPPEEITKPLSEVYTKEKMPDGVLVVGEKGIIYTSHWNEGGLIRLSGEPRLTDVTRHEATKDIPKTLPRGVGHSAEWVNACRGEGKTYSPFEIGGLLTEIGLSGVVAIRAGKSLDWDGANMRATNAPEADKFIRTEWRAKWMA
jgi:predicted dehydrogenase